MKNAFCLCVISMGLRPATQPDERPIKRAGRGVAQHQGDITDFCVQQVALDFDVAYRLIKQQYSLLQPLHCCLSDSNDEWAMP